MYYHNLTYTTIVTLLKLSKFACTCSRSPHNVQCPAFTSLVANFALKTTTLGCDNRRETHQWNLLQRLSPDSSWGQGLWEETLGVGDRYGGYTSLVCGTITIHSSTMSCVWWVNVCCVCRCAWVEGCGCGECGMVDMCVGGGHEQWGCSFTVKLPVPNSECRVYYVANIQKGIAKYCNQFPRMWCYQ